ncbi:MAG: IS66 family insertion sequence element accessory protein TnpB [Erysipelotrichaceae bacterium]|nr:IS66 family insertion sequence element accessory protein TnpB [Erysipelotrichaceae bacterium]
MITFKENKNIYLYSENVDMRMGLNKIQILVASNFSKMEIRHSVFVFCSNSGKIIKMYYEDDYGSWLLQNRLFDGKFKWPKGIDTGTKITKEQLNGLCKGLEVIESKKIINKGINYY